MYNGHYFANAKFDLKEQKFTNMETVMEPFKYGQYQHCVKIMNSLPSTSFLPSQVQTKANGAICKALMDVSDSSVDCMSALDTCLKELQQCLCQIQSFPPLLSNMKTELIILYNWLYLKLVIGTSSSKHDLQALLSECGAKMFKSLSRVLAAVKDNCSPDTSEEEAIVTQLENLHRYCEVFKVYRMLSPLCFAGCTWATLLMYCGKLKQSLTCLESLSLISEKTSGESQMRMRSNGLLLLVSDEGNCCGSDDTHALSSQELVQILKGLCHYRLMQWAQSRDSLTGLEVPSVQSHITYIIGLCHMQEGSPDDCISSLHSLTGSNTSIPSRYRARTLQLMGQCYDRKGLHQCAVQMFREALQIDFSFVLPLYHISQQYRKLGLDDAELEALNLLTTILEDKSVESSSQSYLPLTSFWITEIYQHACPEPSISLLQAMYTLAHRCLQLHRYQDGAVRFLDLLALLYDTPHLSKIKDSTCMVSLPDVRQIYLETAECLLRAVRHDDCVCVCDKALESVCLNFNASVSSLGAEDISYLLMQDDGEELSESITSSSTRKRQRTESCDQGLTNHNSDHWQELQHYMTLTLYKVDALIGLKEQDTAVNALHRAIEVLQECIGCWSEEAGVGMPQTAEPAPKRRRMVEEEVLISADPTDVADSTSSWKPVMVEACCKLSRLLADKGNYSDALHYSRIAVQICPGERRAWFTCCDVLHRQGRIDEAAKTWLQYMGIDNLTDLRYLGRELHKKREQLRKLSPQDQNCQVPAAGVSPKDVLEMDVRSLEYFVRQTQCAY